MRLAFLGTPEVAAGTLRALVEGGHEVVHVVTRADARRGRGPAETPSPVKAVALELGLPVSHRAADLIVAGAQLGVVVAYGRIIKPDVLSALGMVNVHFSLLPRWRGAAPVERAMLAGDALTGVCLMALDEGLDTGPVYCRSETPIGGEETAAQLTARLGMMGNEMLLALLAAPLPEPVPQVGEALYAPKVESHELRLDFSRPAAELHRVVRVGKAWTTFRSRRLLVLTARVGPGGRPPVAGLEVGQVDGNLVGTARGVLELVRVRPEGKQAMDALDWARGARPLPTERLGG